MPFSPAKTVVLIRGAGDLASGAAHRLFRCGFRVVMTEIPEPLAVRRQVAFASAVHEGFAVVEGVRSVRMEDVPEGFVWDSVPVLVDPEARCRHDLRPEVVIDARLLKRCIDTRVSDAPLVIGLGPGFHVGVHAHVVIETNRGHDLGRIITGGEAEPDTGVPGDVGSSTIERVLRAPADGVFLALRSIGEVVTAGTVIGSVDGCPVVAPGGGVVRGVLRPGTRVVAGTKVGDIDRRGRREDCATLSDKARAVSGGVLEAILAWGAGRL
jgi:xanthine dehydrogenase accessory factor